MTESASRLQQVLALIDVANARDPRREVVEGIAYPAELLYSHRMTGWLHRLDPDAGEAVQIAARAQHIRRWEIPRESYPMDRIGYLRWRTDLYAYHADCAAELLRAAGYDEPMIQRVRDMLMKKRLKADPESQMLEDVICLVFLEHEFAGFLEQHAADEPKVINILQRTWKKMSDRGHAAALELLPKLPAEARAVVIKALGGP